MMNQDTLDALTVVSFLVSMANYNENLTQSDKAEIMGRLDRRTNDILIGLQESINEQNEMLKEILRRLEK